MLFAETATVALAAFAAQAFLHQQTDAFFQHIDADILNDIVHEGEHQQQPGFLL